MNTPSQGDPPSTDKAESRPSRIDWEGLFDPSKYKEPLRLFMQELLTPPFGFEFGGVKLVPLVEDGSLFGTPDRQHTYTREQVATALEMRKKLVQLARGDGWNITDDINLLLALHSQPDLCAEHPERFITGGHLTQSPDAEGGSGKEEDIIKIIGYVVRDFRGGILPTREQINRWMQRAKEEFGAVYYARREMRRISDGLEAILEAKDDRERRGEEPFETGPNDEQFARDALKRLVDLSCVGCEEEPRQPAKKDPGDLKN